MPRQHPWDSFIEVATNTLISYVTAMLAYSYIINPIFNLQTSKSEDAGIVGIFTLISVTRQFILRRVFDGKSPYTWLMQRIRK